MNDPTTRFSNRVEDYIRYRPGYPPEAIAFIETRCGLRADSRIADLGSGTGILTRCFLDRGYAVVAVEPNPAMRSVAERLLGGTPGFSSLDGTAERTGLDAGSVNLVAAAQAFHWFEREPCKAEFQRILRPGGWVALLWNDRRTDATPFLRSYEALLMKHATDYAAVNHRNVDEAAIAAFFHPGKVELERFPNRQVFDFDGLKGRCLSSSYVPNKGDAGYGAMMDELARIFEEYKSEGRISFEYETLVYCGRFARSAGRSGGGLRPSAG